MKGIRQSPMSFAASSDGRGRWWWRVGLGLLGTKNVGGLLPPRVQILSLPIAEQVSSE